MVRCVPAFRAVSDWLFFALLYLHVTSFIVTFCYLIHIHLTLATDVKRFMFFVLFTFFQFVNVYYKTLAEIFSQKDTIISGIILLVCCNDFLLFQSHDIEYRKKASYFYLSHWTLKYFTREQSQKVQCDCVSQKIPPEVIWIFSFFFQKRLRIFNRFLHTHYTFLSTLDYKFLFNYLQLWWSYAILSATTQFI